MFTTKTKECVFTTTLQHRKQRRNGGCRACFYSHSIVTLIISFLLSIINCPKIVRVQQLCDSITTLHVFSTLAHLLQFNSLHTRNLHIVRRRACLTHTRCSVLSLTCSSVTNACQNVLVALSLHLTHHSLQLHAPQLVHQQLLLH